MLKRILLIVTVFLLLVPTLPRGSELALADDPPPPQHQHGQSSMKRQTDAEREAAADRFKALRQQAAKSGVRSVQAVPVPGGTPDYFGVYPNYANSPLPEVNPTSGAITSGIRKFVDSLPGLGAAAANNLGQYIPVAVPDKTTYPGSDYYEIELRQYTQKLHSDLPPTTLRGYVQTNTTDPTVSVPSYLGPTIVAQKDKPVRIKFSNKLPTGSGGDLFLPVDTSLMGAGMGPKGGSEMYTQNRATLHLHGGLTPWISDGTPHQWITPAGENTSYPEGVSISNVPDMPDPGPGSQTFFYSNQQSARLMFYHDHAYGITRLNVYGGEAAGYLLQDATEQALVTSGVIPADQIPLIIQDKTFVPNNTRAFTNTLGTFPSQLAAQDPTWDSAKWGGEGNLWLPHVYVPAQNPYDIGGMNPMGRWHYGPWFWPPTTNIDKGPVPNPYYDPVSAPWEPPEIPGTPNPSVAPEAFMDTPVINGTPYPYVTVQPKPYRFRILNAANDRFWNLQFFQAKSNASMWNPDGTLNDANAGEVPMVPADPNPTFPAGWPTDGRDGGVPDPTRVGPSFIQIGNEGGFLPAPVVIANQPVGWNLDPTTFNMGNVDRYALLLGPAERADAIVDFSAFAGQTLILYNDAPAAFPALDSRYDYYTGDPDKTDTGGAPSTLPGYGPNIRTIMQVRVAASGPAGTGLSGVAVTNGGTGYSIPTVNFSGGGGSGAAARATLKVTGSKLLNPGAGYTSAPTVTISDTLPGTGAGATATATVDLVSGTVTGITIVNGGAGYSAPVITLTGGGATTPATAIALGTVDAITLVNPGTAYTSAPTVTISDTLPDTGSGAKAIASLIQGTSFDLAGLQAAFAPNGATKGVFDSSQDPIIVGQSAYDSAYGKTFPSTWPNWGVSRIQDNSLSFVTLAGVTMTLPMQPKAIQDEMGEAYDQYGRMSASLGIEMPRTNAGNQNFILYGYVDPPTETIQDSMTPLSPVAADGTQIWKITHNGVDTHPLHFHLYNVQLINRVGWDGAIRLPDPNELGWKETVRVSPLEDTIVAMRPVAPRLPFGVPESIRPMDVTQPLGSLTGFRNVDPLTGNPVTVANTMVNLGWEFVWHCHILGHEENDMMRPIEFNVTSAVPVTPTLTADTTGSTTTSVLVNFSWTDGTPATPANLGNPANEVGFRIERAIGTSPNAVFTVVGTALANQTSYTDTSAGSGTTYRYRVIAYNAAGGSTSAVVPVTTPAGSVPAGPTGLAATVLAGPRVNLTWTDNATNETGFVIERAPSGGGFSTLATIGPRKNTGKASYVDATATLGSTYSYRVKAVNGTTSSAYSNVITTPVVVPNVIFSDSFESGSFSAWNGGSTGGTSVATAAAMAGSTRGLQALIDGNPAYATDQTPASEPEYHARFYFSPNGSLPRASTATTIFSGLDSGGNTVFQVEFQRLTTGGGTYQLRLTATRAGGASSTNWYTVGNAAHAIEMDWQSGASTSASLYIDGVLQQTLSGLNTSTSKVDSVRLGPSAGLRGGSSGTTYFDAFASTRNTYIGP